MVDVCMYFQVHQPERLRNYQVFEIGKNHDYFDHKKNSEIIKRAAVKCYLPANKLMLRLIEKHKGKFKISYSMTGIWIEQIERECPEVMETFHRLNETGCVEFLSETYYHSLSYLFSKDEFKEQVEMHKKKIQSLFGQTPKVFRNTELIFNNELASFVKSMGYKGILAEGWDHYLGWKSPDFVYNPKTAEGMKLLLRNYKLSDDIAFRFSNPEWKEYPLSAEKFASWINAINGNGTNVNLFMDYETFGEHQWSTTGIFKFLEKMPEEILKHPDNKFLTPSEVIDKYESRGEIDMHNYVSWADLERNLSAWLGNPMQDNSIKELYALEKSIKESKDEKLISDWRKLQTSDNFYYMCTKYFSDGDVHKYFNPYDSPYESFINFMNVLNDIIIRLKSKESKLNKLDSNENKKEDEKRDFSFNSSGKSEVKIKISETPSRMMHEN